MKKFLIIIFVFSILNTLFGVTYDVPRSKVDIRIVVLDGHKYVVGSIIGDFRCQSYAAGSAGGNGSGITLQHFAGCPCFNKDIIITNVITDVKTEYRAFTGAFYNGKLVFLRSFKNDKLIKEQCFTNSLYDVTYIRDAYLNNKED